MNRSTSSSSVGRGQAKSSSLRQPPTVPSSRSPRTSTSSSQQQRQQQQQQQPRFASRVAKPKKSRGRSEEGRISSFSPPDMDANDFSESGDSDGSSEEDEEEDEDEDEEEEKSGSGGKRGEGRKKKTTKKRLGKAGGGRKTGSSAEKRGRSERSRRQEGSGCAGSGAGDHEDEDGEPHYTAEQIRDLRAKLGTVDDLWINVDDIKFDSDCEVSDASEIWSDYGDEIFPASQPKLHKWNPSRKNVSERLRPNERGEGKNKKGGGKRSKTGGNPSFDPSKVPGMSFVPIARTNAAGSATDAPPTSNTLTGDKKMAQEVSGVYFLDFSAHFKQCMKLAREEAAAARKAASSPRGAASDSRSSSSKGSRPRTPRSDLKEGGAKRKVGVIQLPTMDSMSSTAPPSPMVFDISSTPRMFPLGESGTGTIGSLTERSGGTTDDQVSGLGTLPALSTTGADIVDNKGITPLSYGSFSGLKIGPTIPLSQMTPEQQQQHHEQQRQLQHHHQAHHHHHHHQGHHHGGKAPPVVTKEGGLGTRWPKGMWDNMDGHWRMIMAPGRFIVTPGNYNRQYECEFRQKSEKIDFNQLEKTRRKVKKWFHENTQHFTL